MYLQQQQQQQVQQQWILEQQQNQQLQAQHNQQLQMQRQNLVQDSSFGHLSNRKRGFASESDESSGFKKRNLGSESTGQSNNMLGFPEMTGPGTPGSIVSNASADYGVQLSSSLGSGGYFDQSYHRGGAGAGGMLYSGSGLSGGISAPTTPGAVASLSFTSSSSFSSTGVPNSDGSNNNNNNWSSFAQGSLSSPPTPLALSIPGSSSGMTATMVTNNIFGSTLAGRKEPLEYRLLQEQKKLHEAQQQEQHNLQMAQQQELMEMQRHQEEQAKATAMAKVNAAYNSHATAAPPVHHDHNDPATWGYETVSTGQFTGYLGGYGKGYTPAVIGGVAALAAMAASRDTHGAGRGSSMDMDM
ncbi:hypothetical protein EDD21DRAFT_393536 [Dissophora ornata]|nr:hypothetical protein BGZ58_011134 [Dissophora ornata]KAI8594487.1 hypothetical protein EDD21DRAFT_393536 [Dissophora ornata]